MSPSATTNGEPPASIPTQQPSTVNGTTNGTTTEAPQVPPAPAEPVSTLPAPDHHWRITLENKVIAITGANRGIGLGIAEVCLANGAAAVYSLDLFEPSEEFEALATKTATTPTKSNSTGTRLHYIQCDVTSSTSVDNAIDTLISRAGTLHGLVANAGMTKHQPALAFSTAQLEQLFNLNVFGAYYCACAAARAFIRLGVKGSVVFTSSMTSYRPNRAAPSAPYGGTKAAVRNMAHTLAMEWAGHGIRVNSVSPGFVRTAMTYYVEQSPDWADKMRYYGGMPRLAEPRELGGAYVYLLSEGATYTTGIDIPVAGVVGAW